MRRTPNLWKRKDGRAVVTIDGRQIYCGKWGTDEAEERYRRTIAEWIARGGPKRRRREHGQAVAGLTVTSLIARYWLHAKQHYRKPDGTPTPSLGIIKIALRRLRKLYGSTDAAAFGPMALKTLRSTWIDDGLRRKTIGRYTGVVRDAFSWGVSEELIPPSVIEGLRTVKGLRAGRSKARESRHVPPVPEVTMRETLPHLPAPVRAMVELQWLTGCCGGELFAMRAIDIDTSGRVWLYRAHQPQNTASRERADHRPWPESAGGHQAVPGRPGRRCPAVRTGRIIQRRPASCGPCDL